jgi:SAM-dependent methyltransferase
MEPKYTFDNVAREYDKYRPNYPIQLFHDILDYSLIKPSDSILEIGCGTGQATKGFVNLGYNNITCIELGRQLAEITREKFKHETNVRVINSSFEDWQSDRKDYDLAISGTAFHFIEPQLGYRKVFDLLRNRGSIAFFWTVHVPVFDNVFNQIRKSYRKYAPHLDDSNVPTVDEIINERSKLTKKDNLFEDLVVKEYRWFDTYTSDEYISLLNTHSKHRLLPEDERNLLFDSIKNAIEQNGGVVKKPQVVASYLARKRS